jgi:outer membrane protein OmpA-like peptidoglycan-associated protein
MARLALSRITSPVITLMMLAFSTALAAETVKVEGLIIGRSGDEMIVQLSKDAQLAFLLNDQTQVSGGGSNRMAALIPGLKVKVEGTYTETRLLIATSVKFKAKDLQHAQAIEAGLHETKMQAEENRAELERQKAALEAQNKALQLQQEQLAAQQAKIAENKAAIQAAVARFGQLDDYYVFDEVTVYFGNGQTKVDLQYEAPLLALADKGKTIEGYVIEVVGYASSAGSVAENQKLSQQRAANVNNILLQKGHVPLTRMLAPGAMGESQQTGNEKTAQGQAENRRVVVRLLQNKAIAGI